MSFSPAKAQSATKNNNKISSKSDYISLKYGDTTIFRMAVVRQFEFSKFDIDVICRISRLHTKFSENRTTRC